MTTDGTVFIVDDDPGVLKSMRWLLESEGLSVETYSSGPEFLAAYDPNRPGCLLLDLRMPDMNGLELQERLVARGLHPPIIFLTGHGDVPDCTAAMKGGAIDFLEKPADVALVLEIVQHALGKDRERRSVVTAHPETTARINKLTPREREVLRLLHEAKSIKAIAAQLGIGFQTAAKHRARVLEKLQVNNEAELVRLLMNYPSRGLAKPES